MQLGTLGSSFLDSDLRLMAETPSHEIIEASSRELWQQCYNIRVAGVFAPMTVESLLDRLDNRKKSSFMSRSFQWKVKPRMS